MADGVCKPEQWVKLSDADLKAAHVAMQAGLVADVLFHCQQALEKRLKALIALKTGQYPPRLYSLSRLAAEAGVLVPERLQELFEELTAAYTASGYDAAYVAASEPGHAEERLKPSVVAAQWLDNQTKRQKSERDE
ncbi:MAG: HEPN domain-containing protein [Armatimonadetes bacterium]|nr:HEPN domain-containing protein [Armatimonadota bacterium]